MAHFGIASIDWQERINWDRLRTYRTERAREKMKKAGLGAMLCMYDENVRYITGTLTPGWNRLKPGLRYAVLCGDDPPVLFDASASATPPSGRHGVVSPSSALSIFPPSRSVTLSEHTGETALTQMGRSWVSEPPSFSAISCSVKSNSPLMRWRRTWRRLPCIITWAADRGWQVCPGRSKMS